MASSSNILPEEAGPPKATQLAQKKNESSHRSNNNNNNNSSSKITKSTLWCTPNKIFKIKNQLETNKRSVDLDNFSKEISSNFLFNCGESQNGDINENNTKLCQFIEEDNFSLKKPIVNTKVDVNENYLSENRKETKKRNFLYQDVNEALNSLLWQPYEYQNQNSKEEYFSLSSFDSYCSLSSFDLESEPNNEADKPDNSADLHLDVVTMVNNLEGNLNWLNQSRASLGSRELLTGSPPSRLLSNISGNESVGTRGSCRFVPCDEFKNSAPTEMSTHPGCLTSNNIITTTAVNRDADAVKTTVSVVNLNQNSDSLNSNPQQRRPTEIAKRQRNNISSDTSNLNSINVVGLPNHPRHASIPSTSSSNRNSTNTGKGFIFPNHPRNSSEPSTAIQQPIIANHIRNSSTPVTNNHVRNVLVPTTTNLRNSVQSVPSTNVTINQSSSGSSTNISCANIVSILSHHRHSTQDIPNYMPNSLRSASVPKSLTQNIGESSTTTLNITNQQSRVPINVTAVDVNFYRAVPVTVVSNVPTIQCINNVSSETGNSVSNVNIVQAMPPTSSDVIPVVCPDVSVRTAQTAQTVREEVPARTFISTEAQTDDLVGSTSIHGADRALSREQRRRERRERRHLQRLNNGHHQHGGAARDRLPDLLSNHMPPPYASSHNINNISAVSPSNSLPGPIVSNLVVPSGVVGNQVVPSGVVTNHVVVPFSSGQLPLVQPAPVAVSVSSPAGCRFPFPTAGFRRSRYSEEHPKSCCGLLAWKPGSLRWFIALIAVVAVCCVLVGTALGAMRPAGRDHLTVSLLMIGVGIVLVTVSGVAWRLTSHDTSTCRAMLGLGSTESVDVCPRRFVPRLPPTYGRPHHPYAAMIYPEFQYRPPPPTYQASMQEYRLRLLLLDRGNTPQIQSGIQNGPSPPPTYRSYAGSLLRGPLSRRDATQSEYSFPPSYRSQSSTRPGTMDLQTSAIIHSREHSLSISESNHGDSTINNVNLDNVTIDSLKLTPENDINQVSVLLKGSCGDLENSKDANLVTIVQTNDQNPVIVTVSGCSQNDIGNNVRITEVPSEMEILAHL